MVDDERIVRDSAAIVLRKLGYEVEMASSSEEALEMYGSYRVGKEKFDVVILDLNLSGQSSGKDILDEILTPAR
ncbi:MAG: response regulator [Candidatus Zixiibacteriota bacterium]|nr:MAG: response regulator [candidate division Zixibacteria bacterium]